jgi:hypothetical protein
VQTRSPESQARSGRACREGLYIATLFVVWQIINFIFFRTLPTFPILAGGTLPAGLLCRSGSNERADKGMEPGSFSHFFSAAKGVIGVLLAGAILSYLTRPSVRAAHKS